MAGKIQAFRRSESRPGTGNGRFTLFGWVVRFSRTRVIPRFDAWLVIARLVETEIFRVIEGKSTPQPTSDEPIAIDAAAYQEGVPELVAAELVRNVVEPKEFHEFCQFDCVTVKNGDKYYRIPRRPHSLIEVWDASTRRPHARLCVVFEDPGMPPSDEVVMKYLLAKHQPELLWQIGIRFSPPTGKFEVTPPRRWTVD